MFSVGGRFVLRVDGERLTALAVFGSDRGSLVLQIEICKKETRLRRAGRGRGVRKGNSALPVYLFWPFWCDAVAVWSLKLPENGKK